MDATCFDLWAKAIKFSGARVFRLAIGFLADKNRGLLVNAVAQRELAGDPVEVCIHAGNDAVLGLVRYREVVDGEVDVRDWPREKFRGVAAPLSCPDRCDTRSSAWAN